MKLKLADRILALKRVYPLTDVAKSRFLYSRPADLLRRGDTISLWVLLWSDDGLVSIRQTKFVRAHAMTADEWADWLSVHAPKILRDNVLAFVNRSFGTTWNIERVVGWHFSKRDKRK